MSSPSSRGERPRSTGPGSSTPSIGAAPGRLAEALGPAEVEWDCFARRMSIDAIAAKSYEGLSDATRSFLGAYADGVNAVLGNGTRGAEHAALDVDPLSWSPWTPVTVFLMHQVVFGPMFAKVWRAAVAEELGSEALRLFSPETAVSSGSNAFALAGGRTTSGLPLVAGDPHRHFEVPNVYAQVHLSCPGVDVVGFAFPGVPGVQHFAHAGEVAWGLTNASADYEDTFVERLRRTADGVQARGQSGWEPPTAVRRRSACAPPRTCRWRSSRPAVARWSSGVPRPIAAGAFARTGGPRRHRHGVAAPPAARSRHGGRRRGVRALGGAGQQRRRRRPRGRRPPVRRGQGPGPPAGPALRRVPAEDSVEWSGWVAPLPTQAAEPTEALVSANQRISSAYDVLGDDFAAPFRARRIESLLGERDRWDVDSAGSVLGDVLQTAGAALLDRIEKTDALSERAPEDPGPAARLGPADDRRQHGGGSLRVGARAAGRADLRIGTPRPAGPPDGASRRGCCPGSTSPAGSPPRCTCGSPRRVRSASTSPISSARHSRWRSRPASWGERHRYTGYGTPPTAAAGRRRLPGDTDCVFAAGVVVGTDVAHRGPVARYVWDLA